MRCAVMLGAVIALGVPTVVQAAATAEDAKAALAKAEASEAAAGAVRNQWTPTEDALKAARKAIDAGHYDAAMTSATLADALAQRSIQQAKEQASAWQAAVLQ